MAASGGAPLRITHLLGRMAGNHGGTFTLVNPGDRSGCRALFRFPGGRGEATAQAHARPADRRSGRGILRGAAA
jgi:hypothetical protein